MGPLDDCRSVAVSPDGEWLATGSHVAGGVQIWRITDGTEVARLPIDGGTGVHFSPCGNWLMTTSVPCRLWAVGTWREARQIGGEGRCFSPDGRLLVVQDAGKALRLVGTETGSNGRAARKPRPAPVQSATFSPDGTRLVVTTNDGPAVHVWDLRAIRRNLAEMGLDWDAPAYPATDPAAETAPPLPLKVVVNMGTLDGELKPLLQQSQRFQQAGKIGEAISMLRQAVRLSPELAETRNELAWLLVTAPEHLRDPAEALEHARHAIRSAPGEPIYLNTWGVALYRTARFAQAIETLERSLEAGKGQFDACDLFFMAMAHHRLGHHQAARRLPRPRFTLAA